MPEVTMLKEHVAVPTEEVRTFGGMLGVLQEEVLRLGQAVDRLEQYSGGVGSRLRDTSLTVAGVLVSICSVVWMLQTLGVFR